MDTTTLTFSKNSPNKKTYTIPSSIKKFTMKELKSEEFWNDVDENTYDNKNLSTLAGTSKSQINSPVKSKNFSDKANKREACSKKKNNSAAKDDEKGKSVLSSSMIKISNVNTLDLFNYKRYVNKIIDNDFRSDLNCNNNLITLKIKKKSSNFSVDTDKLCNASLSVLDILSKNEENRENYKSKRNKTIQQNCHNLFMTSFYKKEKNEIIARKFSDYKDEMEVQDCSFKPTLISPNKRTIDSDLLKLGFFERREQLKEKTKEKYEKIKNENEKNVIDPCTFKPEMKKRSEPNYNKKFPESKQINKYLERQQSAKQRKEELKILDPINRIKPNINESYHKLYNKQNRNEMTINKEKMGTTLSESPVKRTLVTEKEMSILKQQLYSIPTISLNDNNFNI